MTGEIFSLSDAELEEVLSMVERRQPLSSDQLLRFSVTVRRMSEDVLQEFEERLEQRRIHIREAEERFSRIAEQVRYAKAPPRRRRSLPKTIHPEL